MAKILLNRIEIVISTKEGEYGFRQDFDVGLNLLQADTSRGKSTCLQAIIFVLGLEKALTSKNEIPLTPAVLKEIQIEDGSFLPVLESNIYLEIENSNKERICIQRTAKGKRDNKLITVWFGPRLTNPKGPFRSQDFFVKDAGSASREAGFYTFLAKFFEWSLPIVATYQNGSCPLYMETIFPLLFVEQKRGWGSIQSTLPTYLGIRDMSQRTIEFLLDLDVNKARQKKHELNDREKSLTTEWKFVLNQLSVFSKRENARCLNLPLTPVIQWPSLLEISIEIFNGDKWIGLPEYKKYILEEVQKIEGEIIPKTEDVSESLSEELNSYYDELFLEEETARELLVMVERDREEIVSLDERINALKEDLKRYKDIEKLKKLGSVSELSIAGEKCPTCYQGITDHLLKQENIEQPMSIEQNIKFISAQLDTFSQLREGTEKEKEDREIKLQAIKEALNEKRSKIRYLKATLISDSRLPSQEAIRRKIVLEDKLNRCNGLEEEVATASEKLSDLSKDWRKLVSDKENLPADDLSKLDKMKLLKLEESLISQASDYNFDSFPVESLNISSETYKPTRDGYNIGHDASASDNIRLIWAYLYSLIVVSRDFETNHPGLLILDEPKQQNTPNVGLFAKRVAEAKNFQEQVLIATCDPVETIEKELKGIEYNLISYGTDRIFQKLVL